MFVPLKNDIIVNVIDNTGESKELWAADLWDCPCCDHRIIKGFGTNPIAVGYQPDYAEHLADAKESGRMFTVCWDRGAMKYWNGATN